MSKKTFDATSMDGTAINRPSNPFYRTSNQEYQPNWALTQDSTIKDYTVPPFDEVLAKRYF